MVRPLRLAYGAALGSMLSVVLQCGGPVSAAPCIECPAGRRCECTPNARDFGYFRTVWRQWPGERRPNQTFPKSVGVEVIPTPQPQKETPKPAPVVPPGARDVMEPFPGQLPPETEILPPDGGFQVQPGLPEPGLEPPTGTGLTPLTEPGLEPPTRPGFEPPMEPLLPDGLPGMPDPSRESPPLEPSMPNPLPGLPSDSQIPAPIEPPAEVPSPGLPNAGAQLPEPIPQPTAARPADRPDSVQPELPKPALQTAAVTPVDRQVVAGPALAEVASQPVVAEAVYRKEPGMSEVASEPPAPKQPQLTAPQANWMAALHPGFRGDAGRLIGVYPSTEPEPARPLADAAPKEPRPGSAVPEPVLKQPVEQPNDRGKSAAKVESPPVVLDGYCPVELNDNERWVPGDPRWTAVHHGGTYLFSGPAQRQRFLENPARYTPANSGCDPVLSVDGQRQVPGQTDYCVTYQGRLYMFSSSVTLARFQKNPDHYCAAR